MKASQPLTYRNLELKHSVREKMPFHFQKCTEKGEALPLKTSFQLQARISEMECHLLGCPFSATYSHANLERVLTVPPPSAVLIFLHSQQSSYPLHSQISLRSSQMQYSYNTVLISLLNLK